MTDENKKLGYTEGVVSVIVNTLLFGIKYAAGVMSGSIALMADAWHTLSDSFTSIIIIFSSRISSKPPDKNHPFGHGRIELIASIVIGILLAIVGFSFISESVTKLMEKKSSEFGLFAIIVTIISIVVKEALARFAFWAAKKTGSKAIQADAWHHRSDALSSLVILIGIFLGPYFWWIDSILGIIVALMIFYATFDILKSPINSLLGEIPEDDLVAQVKNMAEELNISSENLHHLHLHRYGTHTELTFHIRLDGTLSLKEAHKTANQLELRLRSELQIEATIHMEPMIKV